MMKFSSLASAIIIALAGCAASPTEAEFSSNPAQCGKWRVPVEDQDREIDRPVNQVLFSKVFLRETNYQRCIHGRDPLKDTPEFAPIALVHSNWMAATNTMSHNSTKKGWEHLGNRLAKTGIQIRRGLENVAAIHHPAVGHKELFVTRPDGSCNMFRLNGSRIGPHTYESLTRFTVSRLMNSPGHRKNILNKDITHHTAATRLNYSDTPCGRHFITQNFVEIPNPGH